MASAGPYASLHLAPDRQPHQHPTSQFFTGRMPFLPPNQQRQSTEGIALKTLAPISTLARQKCDISTNDCTILLKLVVALDSKQKPTKILPWTNKVRACQKGHPAHYKIQWPSASDSSVRGPRFKSHRGRLCLSRQLLRYTALGMGCAPLLQCLG